MKYADDSFMLHTDLYQINMVQTYWQDGAHQRKAVFELYFRNLPFGNGYAVFAGLKKLSSLLITSVSLKVIFNIYEKKENIQRNFFNIYRSLSLLDRLRR